MVEESLKDFYQIGGEVLENTNTAPTGASPAAGLVPVPEGPTEAHKAIDAGKKQEQLNEVLSALKILMGYARSGSNAALDEIIKRFETEPREVTVKITKPLRDTHGKEPSNFGMQVFESEEQFNQLMEDYSMVMGYLPGIEMQVIPTTDKGKRLFVVIGVSARIFNAIVNAERHKRQLERDIDSLGRQIKKSSKNMGVDNTPLKSEKSESPNAPGAATPATGGQTAGGGKGAGGKAGGGAKGGASAK